MSKKGIKNICSRGHTFYKSSDCPVCPTCWSGYYKDKFISDFPEKIGAPALRALIDAKIYQLSDLTKYKEDEIASLHGVGPNAMGKLKESLKAKNLSFKI